MSAHDGGALDAALDALYGAPFGAFVAERKRLAQELKKAGDVAAAKAISGAPKPPVSAWAINRLWRTHRADVDALFDAGSAVRAATGRDLAAFRASNEVLRSRLTALRALAAEALQAEGNAAAEGTLRRVGTTLAALATSGSFAPEPPGRLTADRDPPGFGELSDLADRFPERLVAPPEEERPAARAPGKVRGEPSPADAAKGARARKARDAERAAREAERRRALASARRDHAAATQQRERSEVEVEARQERAARAQEALDAALEALAQAREAVVAARADEAETMRALRKIEGGEGGGSASLDDED